MEKIIKNKEYIVEIIDNGYQGEGIAKIDSFTIFIPNAIKGEKVKIIIVKVTASHAYGKIIEILNKSEHRVEVDCNTYKRCGGCVLRHMSYEKTLDLKRNIVENNFQKLKIDVNVNDTIGMKEPYHYRNKLKYPIGQDKNGNMIIGVYAERTHEIIPTDNCYIQNEEINKIANTVYEFLRDNKIQAYNEDTERGIVRHIIVKIGIKTNEVMIILVVNDTTIPLKKELIKYVLAKHKNVKTIVKNINTKKTNVILGGKNEVIYGDGYIYDYLEEYKFKISPMSFYQVNPIQTEVLYSKAIEYAKLKGNERVLDLYCGIGTIGIFAAKYAKEVYGIEIVEDAIKDAKQNAKINNIENIEFMVGDVGTVLKARNNEIDVVFVDPPRAGLDDNTVNKLLEIEAKKIVYISCSPATLARDVDILSKKYNVGDVQPVDMFPYTSHIESVCLLKLK